MKSINVETGIFVAVKGLMLKADKGLIGLMYVLLKALGCFLIF